MIGLIQRVTSANVKVNNSLVGEINQGILLFLGIEKEDNSQQLEKLLHKVINYRIFEDTAGKMNLSLLDVAGELLIVSQFTLVANTRKGLRPSFSSAAPPESGKQLYDKFVQLASEKLNKVQTGEYGADMQVSLVNDGPVTFLLQTT
jgi:D-tyrosyl-tRNA(Tyr) deacylase